VLPHSPKNILMQPNVKKEFLKVNLGLMQPKYFDLRMMPFKPKGISFQTKEE
jgi:hypothetical protein